jgi:hypothetical protein
MESKYKEKVIRTYGEDAWCALQKEVLIEYMEAKCKELGVVQWGEVGTKRRVFEEMDSCLEQIRLLKESIGLVRYFGLKPFEEYTK